MMGATSSLYSGMQICKHISVRGIVKTCVCSQLNLKESGCCDAEIKSRIIK